MCTLLALSLLQGRNFHACQTHCHRNVSAALIFGYQAYKNAMDLDLELDVVEHEPTVLEFARFHNLCSDFTYELPQCYNSVSISNETFDLDLCDPKDAPPLTDPADELTKERLAVSKEAAMLLKSVHSQAEAPHALLLISNGKKRIINLKQEVPILRTDNEYDLLGFGSVVEPKFTDLNIPLEPIDEDNDEGLGWPSGWVDFPKQCNEQVKSEKLGVSRETLLYLQDAIRNACSPEDSDPIKQETLFYRKVSAIERYKVPTEGNRTLRFNQSLHPCFH
jgi:hypothetical protein